MKKRVTAFIAALLMLFSLLSLNGCGEETDNTPDYPVEVGGVRFLGPP